MARVKCFPGFPINIDSRRPCRQDPLRKSPGSRHPAQDRGIAHRGLINCYYRVPFRGIFQVYGTMAIFKGSGIRILLLNIEAPIQ